MNNFIKTLTFCSLFIISLLLKKSPAIAFSLTLESQINNDYSYTIDLDADDALDLGDRLILTNLSGVTAASANSPYTIDSSDFDLTSANFAVDTAISGTNTLTGVISLTSADALDGLEYQAFYSDNGTPRVASGNIVAVPFNVSPNLGILILLSGFGCHRLKRKLISKLNKDLP
ncbi:hypothetical protein I4641_00300 [Waterburya agarophytonicola K14]|uniref:Cohesin domain-containing protein n=1 Tax=Waterburya agarophytonicola KI4 TaxID=2874699 RepID=A0A964FDT6_9CYAN|nr:hypothetical protein [Waterburya agarophytonicola]MCC0175421.1 hypothetical protein [Waterburya agarophytonicola KI4]